VNKTDVQTLLAYDRWANERIFEMLSTMDEAALRQDQSTSHESIFGTLVHLVGAMEVWHARWESRSGVGLPAPSEIDSLAALRERWIAIAAACDAFLEALPENRLEQPVAIQSLSQHEHHHTFAQMFQHLVNHSSYHRGQIITMLRQADASVAGTDLIVFLREQQQA